MRIKLGVVGASKAGKTSVIESFCGLPIHKVKGIQLVVNNNLISVKFCEYDQTSHWKQYRDQILSKNDENKASNLNLFSDDEKMIEDCQCFIVIYDAIDPFSCSLVEPIISSIYKIKELPPSSIPITILANKIDLKQQSMSILSMYELSKKLSIPLYETCAKMEHSQSTTNLNAFSSLTPPTALQHHKNIQKAVMQLIQITTNMMISQECEVMLYESDSDNDAEMEDIDQEHVCPSCLFLYTVHSSDIYIRIFYT